MEYNRDEVSEAEVLGEAFEPYTEWIGSVAIEDPHGHDDLYLAAGLDKDEWLILGTHLHGGRTIMASQSTASIYAVRRTTVELYGDLAGVARNFDGRIPVVEVKLDVTEAGHRLFMHVFASWTVHAVSRSVVRRGADLAIVERQDPPNA